MTTIKKKKWSKSEILFFGLIVLVLILTSLNLAKAKGYLIPEIPKVEIQNNTIKLSYLTLEQKIAQMVIVAGNSDNIISWKKLQLGGVHIFAKEKESQFSETIANYQQGMKIPFFISADLEGCLNPFANFKLFTAVSKISTPEEAFKKGREEGKYLKSLGFNLNFAPVVDLKDQIWRCRSFPGDEKEITILAKAYIKGLQQEGIIATAKHYPGKTLVIKDPHKFLVAASIDDKDIFPYNYLNKEVEGIMISHIISSGIVDSQGIPAVASRFVVERLRSNFTGLIVTDEINMLGLKSFYTSLDEVYLSVFKAGNDIILNFNDDPNEIYRMIQVVAEGVRKGEISELEIDHSAQKILEAKGFKVEE